MARALEEASHGASAPANALLAQAQGDRLRDADGRVNLPAVAALAAPLEKMSAALDGCGRAGRPARPRRAHRPPGRRDPQRAGPDRRAGRDGEGGATVARLLPPMLGQDGPRDYLLVVQNNAEIRSTGGLPGSLQILTADNGKLTLAEQRSVDGDADVERRGLAHASLRGLLDLAVRERLERDLAANQLLLEHLHERLEPVFARRGELDRCVLELDGAVGALEIEAGRELSRRSGRPRCEPLVGRLRRRCRTSAWR